MKFQRILSRLASYSDHPQHKVSAVVAYKNRVLGLGFNQLKTHRASDSWGHFKHAELSSILNTRKQDLTGAEIYVYRANKSGVLSISFPCPVCYELIKQVGITKIHYTDNGGFKTKDVI